MGSSQSGLAEAALAYGLGGMTRLEVWCWPPRPARRWWGPRGWNWLHRFAIEFARDPAPAQKQLALLRLWNFVVHLPCGECRWHASLYLVQNPPALTSTYTFRLWAWLFHNTVNLRLGKPFFSHESYLALYADEILTSQGSLS
jgi:hypothetical protein